MYHRMDYTNCVKWLVRKRKRNGKKKTEIGIEIETEIVTENTNLKKGKNEKRKKKKNGESLTNMVERVQRRITKVLTTEILDLKKGKDQGLILHHQSRKFLGDHILHHQEGHAQIHHPSLLEDYIHYHRKTLGKQHQHQPENHIRNLPEGDHVHNRQDGKFTHTLTHHRHHPLLDHALLLQMYQLQAQEEEEEQVEAEA